MHESELSRQVKLAAVGDGDALQRLIVHHHAALRRAVAPVVEPSLRRYVDPDDVLQEAYISAFKNIPGTEFDSPDHFYNWLKRIALDRLKDAQRALRRRKRDVAREVPARPSAVASYSGLVQRLTASASTPSRLFGREEAVAAVMSSLARLNDDQRQAITLRVLEDMPVAEVAKRMGKSEVAIYALCRRGLDSLYDMMGSITRYMSRL